ncbi:hypothetical protein L7F22_032045 [Adiantum nelumboides]|nr:hypothetical protein [Adiantum nelumboides]
MEASEEKMEQPCWADMFPDALVKIFSVLPLYDLLHSIPFVCSAWHKASLDAACWTHVDLSLWCCGKDTLTYSRMLSLVVGRSQGALKHIIAPNLIKDSMLQIIAHRSASFTPHCICMCICAYA